MFFTSVALSNPTESVDSYQWTPLEEDEETSSYFYFDSENKDNPKEIWIRIDFKKDLKDTISRSISHEQLDCEKKETIAQSYTLYDTQGNIEVIPANKESASLEPDSETSDAILYNKVCT